MILAPVGAFFYFLKLTSLYWGVCFLLFFLIAKKLKKLQHYKEVFLKIGLLSICFFLRFIMSASNVSILHTAQISNLEIFSWLISGFFSCFFYFSYRKEKEHFPRLSKISATLSLTIFFELIINICLLLTNDHYY